MVKHIFGCCCLLCKSRCHVADENIDDLLIEVFGPETANSRRCADFKRRLENLIQALKADGCKSSGRLRAIYSATSHPQLADAIDPPPCHFCHPGLHSPYYDIRQPLAEWARAEEAISYNESELGCCPHWRGGMACIVERIYYAYELACARK